MALIQIEEEFWFLKRDESLRTDSRKDLKEKETSTFSNIGSQFRFMANQLL